MKPKGRKLPVLFASVVTAFTSLFPGAAQAADSRSAGGPEQQSIVERLERIRDAAQTDATGAQAHSISQHARQALNWLNWGNWGNWNNWNNWRDWRNAWGNYWGNW